MFTKVKYVSFLIHTLDNFTASHLAKHSGGVSHDVVSDFLRNERVTPRQLWELVEPHLQDSPESCLIVDDSVLDKNYSRFIDLVKRQYSGAVGGLVRGVCVVNLVHAKEEDFFPIDYRIYHRETDGKTKNDHFQEMLIAALSTKGIKARTILFDNWYASSDNLKLIHRQGLKFITTLKKNRKVSESKEAGFVQLEDLDWDESAIKHGKVVLIHKVPFPVRIFKLAAQNGCIDWVVTNDLDLTLTLDVVKSQNDTRWKVEELHRELKQLTGIEKCESRSARAQRNHIGCAYQAYLSLKVHAKRLNKTVYAVKNGIWEDFLCHVFANPSIAVLSTA